MTTRKKKVGKGVLFVGIISLVVTVAIAVYASLRADIATVDTRLSQQIGGKVDVSEFRQFEKRFDKFEERVFKRLDKTDDLIRRHDRGSGR